MKRIFPLLAGVCLLMALFATPAAAEDVPPLPHAFYGAVEINDSAAPVGTEVEAGGEGVETNIEGNPITVTEAGKYGGPGGLDLKLVVQGDIEEGATLTFYVDDEPTGQTAEWHSGEVTELDLSVTIAAPGPGPGPTYYYIQTNLFGVEKSYRIESDGELLQTIEATSADGNLTITVPEGTVALDKDSKRLETLEVTINETPPDPPEDAYIIELAYDFTPDGAMFSPPITLTWNYDPDVLPEGVTEESLIIAYYDEDAGEWVEVDSVVDTENNTITASVEHFTTFAIIGGVKPAVFTVSLLDISPTEVAPSEKVNVSVSVANTGGLAGSYTAILNINGVKEAEKSVTIAAGSSETVTFSVTRKDAGTYSVSADGLSGSFTVVAPPPPPTPTPAAFSVSNLSVKPAEVQTGEAATITVSVANTGGIEGSYTVVLKIDGVKEADKSITIAAGESQDVTFTVSKKEAGSYTIAIDGLSGSFTVLVPAKEVNWPVLGGVIAAVIIAGLLIFFLVFRRRAD